MMTDGVRRAYETAFGIMGIETPTGWYLEKISSASLDDGSAGLKATIHAQNLYMSPFSEKFFVLAPDKLYQAHSADKPWAERGNEPILHLPITPNSNYELASHIQIPGTTDKDDDGLIEPVNIRTWVSETATTTASVPAGTFDTIRVTKHEEHSWNNTTDGSPHKQTLTTTTYHARGVGAVLEYTQSDNSPFYYVSRLGHYKTGNHSTDSTIPHVSSTYPTGAIDTPAESVQLTFDDFITPDSALVSLTDAAGQSIPGTITYKSNVVTFTPSAPLTPGTYTAKLTTAEDLMGNKANAHQWTFTQP